MTTLSLPGFGSICALAFADERTLVAGHSEAILTFDVAKMRKGRALDASHHGHGVRALVVRDGGVYALASGYWGVVRWDLATGRYQGKIVGEDEGAGLAMSADGSTLWVARGRKLESYDVRTGAALFDPKRRRPTASISALGRGELAGVAAASDGTLLFWAIAAGIWSAAVGSPRGGTKERPVAASSPTDERSCFAANRWSSSTPERAPTSRRSRRRKSCGWHARTAIASSG